MITKATFCVVLTLLFLSGIPASANMLVNGDFESALSWTPPAVCPATDCHNKAPAWYRVTSAGDIPGWTAIIPNYVDAASTGWLTAHVAVTGNKGYAPGGTSARAVWLNSDGVTDGTGTTVAISQTVATTIGQGYMLSFALADEKATNVGGVINDPASRAVVQVTITGASQIFQEYRDHLGAGGYSVLFIPFIADSTSTTVKFMDATATADLLYSPMIDYVTLEATPEPASFVLFGSGLVGVYFALRRRKNR